MARGECRARCARCDAMQPAHGLAQASGGQTRFLPLPSSSGGGGIPLPCHQKAGGLSRPPACLPSRPTACLKTTLGCPAAE